MAREILASIPAAGDYVLSATGGRKPIIINTKIRDRMTTATGGDDWRIHDLRRTCATQMAELGVQPHVIEAALNHVSGARAGVSADASGLHCGCRQPLPWTRRCRIHVCDRDPRTISSESC